MRFLIGNDLTDRLVLKLFQLILAGFTGRMTFEHLHQSRRAYQAPDMIHPHQTQVIF